LLHFAACNAVVFSSFLFFVASFGFAIANFYLHLRAALFFFRFSPFPIFPSQSSQRGKITETRLRFCFSSAKRDIIKRGCQRRYRQGSSKCRTPNRRTKPSQTDGQKVGKEPEPATDPANVLGKLFAKLNIKRVCTYATLMQFGQSKRRAKKWPL